MRRGATLLAVLAVSLLTAAVADAELSQKGNLLINFNGGITPRALPRKAQAPIAVRIDATIKVPGGQNAPALRRIRIALNRDGRLNTRGLPVCRHGQVDSATTVQALSACRSSLVGAGGVVARTSIADQKTYLLRSDLLLFNSLDGGRPAILAHIYQNKPAPVTHIVVFHIHRSGGPFGTVLTAALPRSLNRNGYLKSIFLQLQRRYTYRGRPRSYLTASCPAPAGFPRASFPFAQTAMTFSDGRTLSTTLIRSCKAKG